MIDEQGSQESTPAEVTGLAAMDDEELSIRAYLIIDTIPYLFPGSPSEPS